MVVIIVIVIEMFFFMWKVIGCVKVKINDVVVDLIIL